MVGVHPFVCGRYDIVNLFLTPKLRLTVWKTFAVNSLLLFDMRSAGEPCGNTQLVQKTFATVNAVIFLPGEIRAPI